MKHYFRSLTVCASLLACGCSGGGDEAYIKTAFVMGVPAQVKVYTDDHQAAERLAGDILKEWDRIAKEFSYSEPYSYTSFLNKKALTEWVKLDEELYSLLQTALEYYHLTDGAFDVTFAPLWPIWKEAAASKKMPAKEEIQRALAGIGSSHIKIDHERRMARFDAPVQVNLGGILRGYCFVRAHKMLKERAGEIAWPLELHLGGNMMTYGSRAWFYEVKDPFDSDKTLGRLYFDKGVVLASSGRAHFVQIEGKLYSHILNLKTGYPLPDFSNFVVYYPSIDDENFIPSVVLSLMGREKAFATLDRMKGTAGVWIDGAGSLHVRVGEGSGAAWEKTRCLFCF
ncbi:MAG: thiamine biosynthesis lipoprotein [Elusimicrobia bacterium]|nr:MAG: thiamine biosynthesis lipoprotein [Elusimicrobiota bacterium]KAF0154151.1 MAG: thiamine biosynthesis lipoprotein [Elusimicrobiota bacterium]